MDEKGNGMGDSISIYLKLLIGLQRADDNVSETIQAWIHGGAADPLLRKDVL